MLPPVMAGLEEIEMSYFRRYSVVINKSGQKNESSSILCKIVIVLLKGVNFRQIFVELVVLVKVIYHF